MRVFNRDRVSLIEADCLQALRKFREHRFDSVVTDPPYELGFMGKRWDASGIAFSVDLWREVLRVLKPGGHLLAFGGTRTYHRMTCAIEDAGFEVRDSLHWIYGTGFPKSVNLGEGRGSALKPGHEPVVLARKPLEGTLETNVEKWGTGGLNIDGCRIGDGVVGWGGGRGVSDAGTWNGATCGLQSGKARPAVGRWPANVLFDEDAAAELDKQSGTLKSGAWSGKRRAAKFKNTYGEFHGTSEGETPRGPSEGGASRFFYVAKPSRSERDRGCEHLPPRTGGEATDREDDSAGVNNPRAGAGRTGGARNFHPTVKPVQLMRYLVRLVTPVGGTVLDPFTGSGTTGIAARLEQRGFVGIEREPSYFDIAQARINHAGGEA